ncbi:MAG: hypothetical protein [Bacteriophage sp.]|nr:MAG: hypothetical protein [Bacteriophage sp.]
MFKHKYLRDTSLNSSVGNIYIDEHGLVKNYSAEMQSLMNILPDFESVPLNKADLEKADKPKKEPSKEPETKSSEINYETNGIGEVGSLIDYVEPVSHETKKEEPKKETKKVAKKAETKPKAKAKAKPAAKKATKKATK